MLAFAHLPDPILHALTTRALKELRRVITHPESWSALDWDYWDEELMELRAVYTDAAIKKASTTLLKAHKDPATLWDLDLHHWSHLVVALGVAAEAHERGARLGPSRVERIDIRPLLRRFVREGMWVHPADVISGRIILHEFLRPNEETRELEVDEETQIGPRSCSLTSLGSPPAEYLEALHLSMPATIALYPIPVARLREQ